MQRGARDLQRAGGVQVSVVSRLVCFICLFHVVYGAALLSADVKYAPVWMETPPKEFNEENRGDTQDNRVMR